jgi:hypothetical protein
MGNKPEKPQPPPPTVKGTFSFPTILIHLEMVKDFNKQIGKMRREFQRTINTLKSQNSKIEREIKTMLNKKEPRVHFLPFS